jgi:membrane AbrB-like protein
VSAPAQSLDVLELGLLLGGSVLGVLLGYLARLPAPEIIGSMCASAALYISGMVSLDLPPVLLNITLCVLGAAIGTRFFGVTLRELFERGRYALGAVFLALGLAAVFALVVSAFLDVGYLAALLALTPGGVAEMCLIAVALDIDPTFVAVHHLARMLFLVAAAPLLGRLYHPAGQG